MPGDESEYEIELFRAQGFQRRKCPECNRFFWTLGDSVTCGEPPCDEYSFIRNPPTKKKLSLHEMRELYLRFFERNNHTRIHRYPIVARWRDDVFFTQASIYCFQPWVLLGVVKPPANPLTISQTCVRFNDIDNVGKTGRHFTMFEMMAHHCFNTKEKQVYFKDRTVELCHRLLTGDLGINPEGVSYIEAQWAGGGNSGPCFEVLVGGVELATLVFMMYEGEKDKRREMDMQVVDTGYGLERFTWLTQGTSSAYEAVFGEVLDSLKKEAGVSGDEGILSEYSKVAGLMNVESNVDLRILRKRAAERLGISLKKLRAEIEPMENLYTVCDHTRALMFILLDSVVPSNVKEGYFARLLVRRTLRALSNLRLNTPLPEIVDSQINFFKKDFPELKEGREEILKLIDVEEGKYRKTLEKGRGIVERLEGKVDKIGLRDLIELYDSQGLTPDTVQEFTSQVIEVPDDFYIKVAEKHEKPGAERDEAEGIKVPEGIPATELGFYRDSMAGVFNARVLAAYGNSVILDETFFYPEGGGQETDTGRINGLRVVDVQKTGNVVVHRVEGDLSGIRAGDVVDCKVDWGRRTQLMQHHTATHILNGAARTVLGNHVWQTGAHKSVKGARLDLTHYAALTAGELKKIESLANKVVEENRHIDIRFMRRDESEKKYGFRLYQGGVVPGGEIRVVNVRDWDVEACGGMHLGYTGDVGSIKITGSKRIQDGVVRLEFVAGEAAEKFMEKQEDIAGEITKEGVFGEDLARIASIFSVTVEELPKTLKRFRGEWTQQRDELRILEEKVRGLRVEAPSYSSKYVEAPLEDSEAFRRLFTEWKTQRKELDSLRNMVGDVLGEGLEKKFASDSIVKEFVRDMDVKTLTDVATKAVRKEGRLLILVNVVDEKANVVVASSSTFHAGGVAKKLSVKLCGGAHGDEKLGVGGGLSRDAEQILKEFMP